jgi:large subunit ribosomal protein L5|uniref:Ribosomal protein L5 n=1 Tax=Entomoneis sp. TaxID=186043 RepID=A0A3G1PWA4_9STRA|nr:ribosomal protein L5 [Entomoneis sp.]
MHILENFYSNNLKYSFINKFKQTSLKTLPTIQKIVLNFKNKTLNLKNTAINLLALRLITKDKKTCLILSKKPNLLLKIKKGNPIGCKIILSKKLMFFFLKKLVFNILPLFKNYQELSLKKAKFNKNSFSFLIKNTMFFSQINNFYNILGYNISSLNLNLVFKTLNSQEQILFGLKKLKVSSI